MSLANGLRGLTISPIYRLLSLVYPVTSILYPFGVLCSFDALGSLFGSNTQPG